jgi:hypothetical protein
MESSRILQALVMHHAMLAAFDSKVSGGDFGLGDEEDLSNLKEQAAHSMAMHGPGCRIDFQSFCRQKKEAEVDQERNKKMRKQIFDLSKHLMSLVSFTQAVVISRAKKPQLTPRTQMPLKRQMFGRDVWERCLGELLKSSQLAVFSEVFSEKCYPKFLGERHQILFQDNGLKKATEAY